MLGKSMLIIPVIDVRHGLAVRAVRGDRSNYRPIVTPLSASADPVDVVRGYMRLFPFKALYIADLDGIEGRGENTGLPQHLRDAAGVEEVWVDNGAASIPDAAPSLVCQVLGSESLANGIPPEMRPSRDWILSLDFRGDEFQGRRDILDEADAWPDRVIVMTLARVGVNEGPDFAQLKSIIARAGKRKVFAAGGVRGRDDLLALRDTGAAGVLIASALHDGKIKTGDLEEIAGESL
jgi:phosphoribosylformimino-5-aminoimidazole carboxamide ribotide isomerase